MTRGQRFFIAIGLTIWGSVAFAGGDDRGGFGMRCKTWFNAVWDPWTNAAMKANLENFDQTVPHVDNIVVAPLWKMQRSPDGQAAITSASDSKTTSGDSVGNAIKASGRAVVGGVSAGSSPAKLNALSPINWLRAQLKEMKASGVTTIYLPPMVPQTLYDFHNPADGKIYHNDHGYWGKTFDHKEIDPKLGTRADYLALLAEAKALGLKMALDVNMRHFGYFTEKGAPFAPVGGKIKFHDMELDIKNPDHFYQSGMSTLDLAKFEALGPGGQHIITQRKMWDLPALNVANPEIRKRLIADQLSLVDLGFTTFRIDAAKHVTSNYLNEVIGAMSARIKSNDSTAKGKFILEYLSGNYAELGVKLSELKNKDGVYFIDFPMAWKVRESVLNGANFGNIKTEMEKMEGLGLDQAYFIQAITDQDAYFPPMYHGDPRSLQNTFATTMMSNVLSTNRPYYVAGLEQAVPVGTQRNQPSKLVDTASEAYPGIKKMNDYFNTRFGELVPFKSEHIIVADGGKLVVKRPFKTGGKSLLMVIDRSTTSSEIKAQQAAHPGGKEVFRWGEFGGEVECYLSEVDSPQPSAVQPTVSRLRR